MEEAPEHLLGRVRRHLQRRGDAVAQLLVSTRKIGHAELLAAGLDWHDEEDDVRRWHAWAQLADGSCWLFWLEFDALVRSTLRAPLTSDLFAPAPNGPLLS